MEYDDAEGGAFSASRQERKEWYSMETKNKRSKLGRKFREQTACLEPVSNISVVRSSSKRRVRIEDPGNLVGRLVKKAFFASKELVSEGNRIKVEFMWVQIEAVDDSRKVLIGTLKNSPFLEMKAKLGDKVEVALNEIVDIM